MSWPLPFLVGLLAAAAHSVLFEPLPADGLRAAPWQAVAWLPISLGPGVLAFWFHRWLVRRERSGLPRRRAIRKLARLQSWSVPIVALVVQHFADWGSFAQALGGGVRFTTYLLLLTPLLIAENVLRLVQAPTARRLRLLERDVVTNLGPPALRLVWLVVSVLLAVAGATDLLALYRPLEVFLLGTQPGSIVFVLLLLGLMSMLLPLGFRWLLPTSVHLPPRIADALHGTASRLGFSERAVLSLDTQHRFPNALMVGLLGWPRYLVLTDALMSLLEVRALQGVVAHEIGHARRHHTTILLTLFGLVPAAGLYGAVLHGWLAPDGWEMLAAAAAIAVVAVLALRPVSHRFEHEADIESARALGAEPCIEALQSLGYKLGIQGAKATWRHPSEHARVRTLRAWETDDQARGRFERRGRQLRASVLAASLVALAILGWGLLRARHLDRATQALYLGELGVARASWIAVDPGLLTDWERDWWQQLGEVLDAAASLAADGRDDAAQVLDDGLRDRAWAEGLRWIGERRFDEAMPYLDLACRSTDPDAGRLSTFMLAAVLDGRWARHDEWPAVTVRAPGSLESWFERRLVDRLREHVAGMELAPEVEELIRVAAAATGDR